MKFKPGLTVNFIPRYAQISRRAFRYFKNKASSYADKPIVSIRKTIIKTAVPYQVNKGSYLKRGSAIAKSHREDAFFDNMFEVLLNEDYEDNVYYRNIEHEVKVRKETEQFIKEENEKRMKRISSLTNTGSTRKSGGSHTGKAATKTSQFMS